MEVRFEHAFYTLVVRYACVFDDEPPSSLLILLHTRSLTLYDTDKTHHRRRLCVYEISTRIRIDTHAHIYSTHFGSRHDVSEAPLFMFNTFSKKE